MRHRPHPRLKHYPQHAEYAALAAEFRPFVMFTHQPHYRSASVNTDSFGLRMQHDAEGKVWDWTRAADYPQADLLIGNSTSFGVDVTSDRATISSHLQKPGCPCINLSVRGANSRQELLLFLAFRDRLPPVRNVILFSGVCNCSLAALDRAIYYPDFGGVFSEKYHFTNFYNNYDLLSGGRAARTKRRLNAWVDRWAKWLRKLQAPPQEPPPDSAADFAAKNARMLEVFREDMTTWRHLEQAMGFKLHYVLQPVLHWTSKPLTPIERECLDADLQLDRSALRYANPEFYAAYARDMAAHCARLGVDFHDANIWFNSPELREANLFSDVCHLTDAGSERIAQELKRHLHWK